MEVLGITTGGKVALVALIWGLGAGMLGWALNVSPEERKKDLRSKGTFFTLLASFLPASLTRWFYLLLGLACLVAPVLAFTGVMSWQ